MSIFEIILTYAICWWLVLFMVLPFGARAPEKPPVGHAPSAPANPMIKKKLLITSVLAVIPVVLFGLGKSAFAESGVYHAGSNDCAPSAAYQSSGDVNADSETGSRGVNIDRVQMGLDVPAVDYVDNESLDKLYSSELRLGMIDVDTKTGETRMNGQRIDSGAAMSTDCEPK